MKMAKRMFTILMSVLMVLALALPAFAADLEEGKGSITINNATAGQSYTIYQIFETDSTGHGNVIANEDQKKFYEGFTGEGEDSRVNPFVFTKNPGSNDYTVTVKDDVTNAEVIEFLQGFVTETTNGTGEDKTTVITVDPRFAAVAPCKTIDGNAVTSSTVEFEKVPYGYYLVTSSLGAVVTINSTTPDVEIIDKNQDGGSNFTKKVNEADEVVEIGDEFGFTLEFTATNYDGEKQITEYTITDTLATAMDLVYTTGDTSYGVTVKVGDSEISDADIEWNDHVLTITIPWATTSEEDGAVTSTYTSPIDVEVTYTVKLNATAGIQEDISNTATLSWTGNTTTTGTTVTETVQTYALAIMKVDEKGKPLSGATFTVKKGEEAVNVTADPDEPGVYVVDPDSKSNTVVSPASGLIVIKGVDNTDYTLTETAAPAGYNLLKESVTITPANTGTTTITIYKDKDGNVVDTAVTDGSTSSETAPVKVTAKVVVNEAGAQLPSTGGMGTVMFYVLGGVLVVAAGVLLVTKRRMKDDK